MEKFVRDTLSKCLDCVVTDQMMSAILSIKDDYEFDSYFGNLLSEDNEEHRLFLLNCRRMLLSGKQPRNNAKSRTPTKQLAATGQIHQNPGQGAKGKAGKYVNLYASDGRVQGDTILLKGRRHCDCQAAQHKLINNCLGCGRIVCEQEGSGPCLCCGDPVHTAEEEQQLAKAAREKGGGSSKAATKQGKKASKESAKEALDKALAQRDRLLEYDKNSEKRTTVIDDELDYFQENSVWLSDAEREKFEKLKSEMQDMKHGSRLKRKIRVDFAGRELPEEPTISKEYEQQVISELAAVTKASGGASNWSANSITGHSALSLAPNLDMAKPPVYRQSKESKSWPAPAAASDGLERIYNRVQDKELLEMQDMRQCLSMHQPWASLLVAGIKKHEGRVWYSEHRGRLWIASTSKEPHSEDIAQMEGFYKVLYGDPDIKFPSHYPTSSLLGCVHVDSCLPQEEYREAFPNGESESPYVFVCTKPEQLNILLPVQGDHKIYELPLKTHTAACKTLLRAKANKG
ncbi:activating signal cointegrator 1 [Drosophila takahashii]|uniref:activating signal cointegrator 1 n=1 Tax=Drosophila takahashii TaxID=29030 RepID=UPI001CF8AE16|nr:activating signal cointegrator 1 [Drosophila takahashii]XP_044250910.1 activating signal cointegrator 1-like [Drosophila takahashii]